MEIKKKLSFRKLDVIGLIMHLVKAYYLITRMVESGKFSFTDAELARVNIHNALEHFKLYSIVSGNWDFHQKLNDEYIEEVVKKAISIARKKYSNEIYELKKINK